MCNKNDYKMKRTTNLPKGEITIQSKGIEKFPVCQLKMIFEIKKRI